MRDTLITEINAELIPKEDITYSDFVRKVRTSENISNYDERSIMVHRLEVIEHSFDITLNRTKVPFVMYTTLEERDEQLYMINASIQTHREEPIDYSALDKELKRLTKAVSDEPSIIKIDMSIRSKIEHK